MKKIRLGSKDILFEDDHYIAVNKKRGWPVHSTLDKSRSNLFDALKSYLKHRDSQDVYLALHHRIDLHTSGIVIFAKSKAANPILSDIFKERKAKKIYLGLCFGVAEKKEGTLSDFFKKTKVGKKEKMLPVRSGGVKMITGYRVLESNEELSLVEFDLITGRTHQIRAHSDHYGFPLVGDLLYGDEKKNRQYQIEGQLLHAHKFSFFDPLSSKEISISAPAPFDLSLKDFGDNIKEESKKAHDKRYVIFNKPYNVLCQFTKQCEDESSLADFSLPKEVYPAGRLDKDSEGLLLLTNDGDLINKIASPKFHKEKTYWVQVERIPSTNSLKELASGVTIKGGYKTRPCRVKILDAPSIAQRNPPIRERKNVPTCWLEIVITEGRNRQVRRMTAKIGHPTLRLIRVGIGKLRMDGSLRSGEFKELKKSELVF